MDLGIFYEIAGIVTINRYMDSDYRIMTYKIANATIGSSLEFYDIYQENGEDKVHPIII